MKPRRSLRTGDGLGARLASSGALCLLAGCSLTVDVDALQSGLGGSGQGGDASSSTGGGASTSTGGGASSSTGGGGGAGGELGAYAASVLADGPIAYFRFEEASGTSCKNEVDGSPNTCAYPTTEISLGAVGASGAGHCFTSSNVGTNIFGSLDFPADLPFTIEFWANVAVENAGQSSGLLSDMLDGSNTADGRTGTWLSVRADGYTRSETWVDGSHYLYTEGTVPFVYSQWVHVVLQHSDIDRIYVDLQTGNNGVVNAGLERKENGVPLTLGGFVGCIDELAVYDYALPIDRMGAHFAARSAN